MKKLVIALQSLFSRKRLSGKRVFLRPPKRRDAIKWQKLRLSSKSFLSPWEPKWDATSCSRRAFMKYLKNSSYLANIDRSYSFLIFKDDDKDLVGGINIFNVRRGASQSSSIGYWIGKRHSRKGYMYEALKILLPSLFIDLRLHRIEAAVLKHNKPSRKLLEKIGFIEEGVSRAYLKIDGEWQDHVMYSLLRKEYEQTIRQNPSN